MGNFTTSLINKLETYFRGREDVAFAFLFGSRSKNTSRVASDWDIGVYFISESEAAETEIWSAVEQIVNTEVDLVVLNRAPASLAWNIIRRTPLLIKDRRIYLDFLIRTSHEANDWYHTAENYHQIFLRSASLSREDRARLEKIIQFLELEVSDFPKFEKMTWNEYTNERPKKREVERWVEQIVNAVINVAEIILASEKRIIPETYRELVQTLGSVKPFNNKDLCQKLSYWTGLRNILAHEYLDYRWKNITKFIQEAKPELSEFLIRLKKI